MVGVVAIILANNSRAMYQRFP
jgi:hypothetical protein